MRPWVEIDNELWSKTSFVIEIPIEREFIILLMSSLFASRDSSAFSFSFKLVEPNARASKKGRRTPDTASI